MEVLILTNMQRLVCMQIWEQPSQLDIATIEPLISPFLQALWTGCG